MENINQAYQELLKKHNTNKDELQKIDKLYQNQLQSGLEPNIAKTNVLAAATLADKYQKCTPSWAECFHDFSTLIVNVQ